MNKLVDLIGYEMDSFLYKNTIKKYKNTMNNYKIEARIYKNYSNIKKYPWYTNVS